MAGIFPRIPLATLLEVGYNHFFYANHGDEPGDFVYFQGHASPGVYARAFLEGRLTQEQVENYRHELRDKPGLSSYPHPWLMPSFWRFPTVSMGLGPLNAIYQARFMRYLENRGLIKPTPRKVWAFIGDGETDEPEVLGSQLTLAAREKLDNLIFVVNCNLQRLDGPVRGNGKIVNELEAAFRGTGWNVIKVLWGSGWDELLARDHSGMLIKRMEECVDGEYQAFKAKDGAYVRKEFFGKYPETALVADWTDDEIFRLQRGGLDPQKVYNAYKRAVEHKGGPTVILAKTIKGYGLGSAQARNATHQEKKMTDEALTAFRSRFEIPIPDNAAKEGSLYRPPEDSPEIQYMLERRKELGGFMPNATPVRVCEDLKPLVWRLSRNRWKDPKAAPFDNDGFREHVAQPHERPQSWKAGGPDYSRRSSHVRHGVDHPAGGHLCEPGPTLQAARCRHAALLSRGKRRTDIGRRNH